MTQAPSQPNQRTTILVVENDFDTLEFYEILLMAESYQVRAASTGQAALAYVAIHPLNGIVLDRRLPDFDGLHLCRLLREHVGTQVPIIFVTADREPALESLGRAAGIMDFLLKPFHPADLLDRVRRFT